VARFAGTIVAAITREASLVRPHFAPKPNKDATPLREAVIDLEVGTTGASAPEIRSLLIFRDRFIGAAHLGHPLLEGVITPQRYAACDHVVASRRGAWTGPVDDALREIGLTRRIIAVVPSFLDALAVARQSHLVALMPRSCLREGELAAQGLQVSIFPSPRPNWQSA
jgi:DNA-binding transcriptional LysR family regulator